MPSGAATIEVGDTTASTVDADPVPRAAWWEVGLVWVCTLLLGATRVTDRPYWFDEAATAHIINRSFRGLLDVLGDEEAGMAPFYVALWLWSHVVDGDAGLRMLSVAGGATCAALVYLVAVRWFDRATGVLAVVLLVGNPFFLTYLTELRVYSWIMALSVASCLAIDVVLHSGRTRDAAVAGVVAGLGVASHLLFAAVPVIVCTVAAATGRRISTRCLAVMLGAASIVVVPTLPAVLANRGQLDWIGDQTFLVAEAQLRAFVGGRAMATVLLIGLLLAATLVLLHRMPRWPLLGCVTVAIGFPAVVVVLSLIKPLLLARYLAPAFPFVAVAAAAGFVGAAAAFANRAGRAIPATVAGLALIVVAVLVVVDGSPFRDSRTSGEALAVEFVLERADDGDAVIIADHRPAVLHHLGYESPLDIAGLPLVDDSIEVPRRPVEDYLDDLRSSPRIFVIRWLDWPIHPSIDTLLAERGASDHAQFGDVGVWEFRRPDA